MRNIMEIAKSDNIVLLRAGCASYDKDNDATIEVEYNKKINQISVIFYKEFFHIKGWGYKRFWTRLKLIWKLLIGKPYTTVEDFQIVGERQITDFILALEKARVHVLENSQKYD